MLLIVLKTPFFTHYICMENQGQIVSVESPCIRHCCLDENDVCLGCFRTLTEITQWTLVDKKTQQSFLENASVRKAQQNINQQQ